jgi:integrase
MSGHLHKKTMQVSGHLEDRRGIYHIMLNWIDRHGERGRKSMSTNLAVKGNKKRAEEMLRTAKKEVEERLRCIPDIGTLLFADFLEQWLETVRKNVRITTFSGYQINVQKKVGPWFRQRGILLSELTADDINEFYEDKLLTLKATSVRKFHAIISLSVKYAVEKNMIPHSMLDKVKPPAIKRFVGKFLRQHEAVALFDAVRGDKLELGVILGAFYGLRRSEVVGLRWDSIDFEANSMTIEHTVTEVIVDGKRRLVVEDTTKSQASLRSLPLVPQVRALLLDLYERKMYYEKLCGKSYNKKEGQYVYSDALGNRITPQYLSKMFLHS